MKKIMLFAAFAAALTLSSCKKEANNDEPAALRTIHFSTIPSETKTVFGEKSGTKYPVLWQAGDIICPSLNFAAPSSANYIAITPSSDGSTASFYGQFTEAESYQFIFVSPAATFKSINKANQTVMVEFPSGQNSTAASPDPAAQILYANTGELTTIPSPVTVDFEHLSAYLHLTFTNVDLSTATGTATVQAVNITNADHFIAGRIFFNIGSGEFTSSTEFNTISVATNTLTDVWCALCPCDLSGKQLTIEVSTDQGTLTKVVNMPANANLTRGKIAKFTVDMTGISLVAPVVYKAITSANDLNVGDKVIIAAAGVDQAFAMSTGQNGNNRSAAGVTKTETEIVNPTGSVEIYDVEDGVIPGHFAFRTTNADSETNNDGYIYAANQNSSGSNQLKTKATMDNSASWAVSVENVTVGSTTWENATRMFADIPSTGKGLLRFNSSDKLFAAYGNTTAMEAVKLYRLDEPAAAHFNATLPNGNDVSAAAQDITVYVWGNVAWTASVNGTGASLDNSSGTGNAVLTLSIPENTSTTSTQAYSVTITTSAAVATQSYTLNITQLPQIAVGSILYWEYFDGATHLQSPSAYLSSGNATTTVFGGASVAYTSAAGSGNTRAYVNDNIVYDGDFATYLPSSVTQETNMMVGYGGGWLKIAGIPCKGVATAFLEYDSNNVPDEKRFVSSPTDGVSMGTVGYDTYRSTANNKAIRHIKYTITFDSSKNLETFDLQFNNNYTGNIRVTNVKLTVLSVN